jgi:hypothetical protein
LSTKQEKDEHNVNVEKVAAETKRQTILILVPNGTREPSKSREISLDPGKAKGRNETPLIKDERGQNTNRAALEPFFLKIHPPTQQNQEQNQNQRSRSEEKKRVVD